MNMIECFCAVERRVEFDQCLIQNKSNFRSCGGKYQKKQKMYVMCVANNVCWLKSTNIIENPIGLTGRCIYLEK